MLALSFSIEGLGRYILKVWDYPLLNEPVKEIILILFYPFILFSFREMYGWLKNISKNWAFVTSMFLGIIIWEIPNLFSHDWIYHLDFFPYNIFGLNIIAILGWSFLIFFPDFGYREYLIKDRGNK